METVKSGAQEQLRDIIAPCVLKIRLVDLVPKSGVDTADDLYSASLVCHFVCVSVCVLLVGKPRVCML